MQFEWRLFFKNWLRRPSEQEPRSAADRLPLRSAIRDRHRTQIVADWYAVMPTWSGPRRRYHDPSCVCATKHRDTSTPAEAHVIYRALCCLTLCLLLYKYRNAPGIPRICSEIPGGCAIILCCGPSSAMHATHSRRQLSNCVARNQLPLSYRRFAFDATMRCNTTELIHCDVRSIPGNPATRNGL